MSFAGYNSSSLINIAHLIRAAAHHAGTAGSSPPLVPRCHLSETLLLSTRVLGLLPLYPFAVRDGFPMTEKSVNSGARWAGVRP